MEKRPIIVITGPTASGKTELSIMLAELLNTDVINADSMQIYKGLDIISAAPTKQECDRARHHLFSFKELNEEYSVGDYVSDAEKVINSLEYDKIPIVCGGTGLYISSLINSIDFSQESSDEAVRLSLKKEMDELGPECMHKRLSEFDPEAAKAIHPNNKVRVIRALEIIELTGKTFTEYKREAADTEKRYEPVVFSLNYRNREILYQRINKRVERMVSDGMLEEAERALKNNPSKTAMSAIGLKEFKAYFSGESDLENVFDKIKQASRNYAKRQITWIKRIPHVNWIFIEDFKNFDEITDYCFKIIKERFSFEENH